MHRTDIAIPCMILTFGMWIILIAYHVMIAFSGESFGENLQRRIILASAITYVLFTIVIISHWRTTRKWFPSADSVQKGIITKVRDVKEILVESLKHPRKVPSAVFRSINMDPAPWIVLFMMILTVIRGEICTVVTYIILCIMILYSIAAFITMVKLVNADVKEENVLDSSTGT